MKKIFYHKGTSNRIRFVTITKFKGYDWTDEPNSIKVDESVRPASELIGKMIELDGHKGHIVRPLSTSSKLLKGEYVGQKKWLSRRDMAQFNHFVVVKWQKGCPHSTRQPLFKFKLI